jgi:transposase-like protein
MNEYDYKGFMQDFMIADAFGINAIKDTYKRAFKEWKNNVEYFASFVMTLNHQIWRHYETNETYGRLYDELWRKADLWGSRHFKGKDAEYYFSFLD